MLVAFIVSGGVVSTVAGSVLVGVGSVAGIGESVGWLALKLPSKRPATTNTPNPVTMYLFIKIVYREKAISQA